MKWAKIYNARAWLLFSSLNLLPSGLLVAVLKLSIFIRGGPLSCKHSCTQKIHAYDLWREKFRHVNCTRKKYHVYTRALAPRKTFLVPLMVETIMSVPNHPHRPQKSKGPPLICMGCWPSVRSRWLDIGQVFFLKLAKKERGQYPAILTEQTWSIKDLLYGFWGNFACGIQRVVPSGHLARSGSQS